MRFLYIYALSLIIPGSVLADKGQTLIQNGAFNQGLSRWKAEFKAPAIGSAYVDGGAAKMMIDRDGTTNTHIQLFQEGISLSEGVKYTLKFDIKAATSPKSCRVIVQARNAPGTRYLDQTILVTTPANVFQNVSLSWIQPTSDNNVKLGFHLGTFNDRDIWIDNVSLNAAATLKDPFTLQWRDDFNELSARWVKNIDGTFCGNEVCYQATQSWSDGGSLIFKLQKGYVGSHFSTATRMDVPARNYISGSVQTAERYRYGRLRAAMKSPGRNGYIQSCGFFRDDPSDNYWTEFVIELEGSSPAQMHTNIILDDNRNPKLFCDPYDYAWKSPQRLDLPKRHDDGFSIYQIDWTPEYIKWYIDGELKRSIIKSSISAPNDRAFDQPAQILLSLWSSNSDFGGTLDPNNLPIFATWDWVEYYAYTP